jgi:replication-associated recombination protein RarA
MLQLHSSSRTQIDRLADNLPQSLLLSGPKGVGLGTLAKQIAGKNLAGFVQPKNQKGEADPEGTVSVEMIRDLYNSTRSKQKTARIIIIDDADQMSPSASGAFLKLLEEPTEHTHFILTSHAPQTLLPTIKSRVQEIKIQPLDSAQSEEYLTLLDISDKTKRAQLQFIASGLPAEIARLANDGEYFAKKAELMSDARTFLTAKTYEKLLIVQKYQSSRELALQLLDSALTIARRGISAKPQQALISQLDMLLTTRENIAANFNVRLQLTRLVL